MRPGELLEELPALTSDDDDLDHMLCCNENLSVCGRDISGLELVTEDELLPNPCVVCELMTVCPVCGHHFGGDE